MENQEKRKRKGILRKVKDFVQIRSNKKEDQSLDKADKSLPANPVAVSDAFQEIQWSDADNLEIIPYFGKVGEVFQNHGFKDGTKGLDGIGYYNLAKSKVKVFVDDIKGVLTAQQTLLNTRIAGLQTLATSAKNDFDTTNRIITRRSNHPREYSVILAVIYLFVALMLVLADIPIAVTLIQNGFDLAQGTRGMEELFAHPGAVLAGNWETWMTATGISLCSIFFKILYDDYVSGPLSSKATMTRREVEIDQNDENDIKAVKRAFNFRVVIKVTILLLTISTILALGFFRYETYHKEKSSIGPQFTPSGELIEEIEGLDESPGQESQPENGQVSFFTKIAFILITLLFPMVSGVCFSLGMDRVLNRGELTRAQSRLKRTRNRHISTEKDVVETSARLKQVGTILSWVQSSDFFRKYLDFLLSCYAIGYERGQMSPDNNLPEKGYFEMITRMRRKIVSRQVLNSIKAANHSDEESIQEIFSRLIQKDTDDNNLNNNTPNNHE